LTFDPEIPAVPAPVIVADDVRDLPFQIWAHT